MKRRILSSFILVFILTLWFSSAQPEGESSSSSQWKEPHGSNLTFGTSSEILPEEVQVALLLKILTYDRSLAGKVKDTIQVGVLYFPENGQSKKNKDVFMDYLRLNKDKTINGTPFSFVEIEFSTETKLEEITKQKRINVIYVTSEGGNAIKEISHITQTKKILTLTGQLDFVNRGLSVGLGVKEEKPQIVINLPSARAEGSDFSANLLKLCRVLN